MEKLKRQLGDNLSTEHLHRLLYATDASVYRELPFGVAWPRNTDDLHAIVAFARENNIPLIPRTAGTSLAGQVVGHGLVVDFSRHLTQILEVDHEHGTATVQPGVIRDILNLQLKPLGWHFGPNTSTANRCMMGGMVGNNSCGSTSIIYGSTRDRLLALDTILSDGSEARFTAQTLATFTETLRHPGLEGRIYRHINSLLSRHEVAEEIRLRFPKPIIQRRNTGYALDLLLQMAPFQPNGKPFNFCSLLAGSEGTLALSHQITLQLDPLPPPHLVLVCAHFHRMRDMTEAVLTAMTQPLYACELMDKTVLDCTKASREQQQNRFFLEGDPAAVLIMECRGHTPAEAEAIANNLEAALRPLGTAYALVRVHPPFTERVWALRAAGLGVLANLPGDAKAVACIEDTAVALEDLPDYIDDLDRIIQHFGQKAAYFAHAGAGEIHVRPILDLKKSSDQVLFQEITAAVADLVKRYQGSFSGEHGDGRLRGSFIPRLLGEEISGWFADLKETWDPQGIFNPGKITAVPPMLESLRYKPDHKTPAFDTALDFSDAGGILRMAERCNGSGDCRKLPASGGTMCPSYQATHLEKDSTRARANALREYLTNSENQNPFLEKGLAELMDRCLSCKGCTRECPSGVDISTMKAEWQHQVHEASGIPLQSRFFGELAQWHQWPMKMPRVANALLQSGPLAVLAKKTLGIHPKRTLPRWNEQRFTHWFQKEGQHLKLGQPLKGKVWLFVDEFTEHFDLSVGIAAVRLLKGLGYEVQLPNHVESGRAAISKGLLHYARKCAQTNVRSLAPLVGKDTFLIGLEPSSILTLRDEYLRLVGTDLIDQAHHLAKHTLLLEEFLFAEAMAGRILSDHFDDHPRQLVLHGHCHQKALSEQHQASFVLSLPKGHQVSALPTGCCGMAGSFGYEHRHFELSMAIGELVLFPSLRTIHPETIIVASGHSCRHQIAHGVARQSMHVAEVLVSCLAPLGEIPLV